MTSNEEQLSWLLICLPLVEDIVGYAGECLFSVVLCSKASQSGLFCYESPTNRAGIYSNLNTATRLNVGVNKNRIKLCAITNTCTVLNINCELQSQFFNISQIWAPSHMASFFVFVLSVGGTLLYIILSDISCWGNQNMINFICVSVNKRNE